ncbi:MAG: transcriptional repressor [Lachnospiraceae bacterium]|nr:transcriptional repressor [Lachnospiraceae bacterium]
MVKEQAVHIIEPTRVQYPQVIKWTRQRRDVYDVLWQAKEPLTAAQIYSKVVQKSSEDKYAMSTIYRILAAFEEKGLVGRSTWMGDGTVVYELNRGGHTHYAVCLQCHKKVPLAHCPFVHLNLEKEPEGFTITSHKLELYGYCRDCKMS